MKESKGISLPAFLCTSKEMLKRQIFSQAFIKSVMGGTVKCPPVILFLLLVISLLVKLSLNFDGKSEQVDESCAVSLVINFIGIKCSNFFAVESVG